MRIYDIARFSLVITYLKLINFPQKPERVIKIYSNPKMTIGVGVSEANAFVHTKFIR